MGTGAVSKHAMSNVQNACDSACVNLTPPQTCIAVITVTVKRCGIALQPPPPPSPAFPMPVAEALNNVNPEMPSTLNNLIESIGGMPNPLLGRRRGLKSVCLSRGSEHVLHAPATFDCCAASELIHRAICTAGCRQRSDSSAKVHWNDELHL